MKLTAFFPRPIAILVCATMLAAFLPQLSIAQETKERVQVKLGKPSVWSLAQAHYLLASMHKKNSKIGLNEIKPEDLDPNAANATRLQILRTVLGVQAEFNQKIGAENQSKLREEQVQVNRRADAQIELAAKEEELRSERAELNGLKKRLAVMQETDRQREEEREAQSQAESPRDASEKITIKKFIALTDDDEKRKTDIAKLQQKVAAQQAKVDGLNSEVTALNTQANAAVTPASLSDTSLTSNTIALPTPSTSMQKLIDNALNKAGKPSLAASIALDNYIGMQYEIIAKQLTLLRDEIGPDERVIFLELPSSIYTVPCKSEDYIVQVHWKVTEYYKDPAFELADLGLGGDEELFPASYTSLRTMLKGKRTENFLSLSAPWQRLREFKRAGSGSKDKSSQPSTTEGQSESGTGAEYDFDEGLVRAIDIIPRQSALNVNDFHATASQNNFLGVLKLLSGIGVRVDYQRQRELYEEFLQQEVFASGFGKGRKDFGWTFGPLPGTNRIAPGQRTTYAVLAVPRDASGLRLEADAIAYKRTKTPSQDFATVAMGQGQVIAKDQFVISVPNEQTEGFYVKGIEYTPVQTGSPVTAVLRGDYFSPQINVFVENTPLQRVLNFGSKEPVEIKPAVNDSKIKGFFELVNSRELIITFDMGNTEFVGTPNITLVTPEKTSSINFFKMEVNRRPEKTSLRESSLIEPMFMKNFGLTALEIEPDGQHLTLRLTGTGMRRGAEIWVNDHPIPQAGARTYDGMRDAISDRIHPPAPTTTQSESPGAIKTVAFSGTDRVGTPTTPRASERQIADLRRSLAETFADRVCDRLNRKCEAEVYQVLIAKRKAELEDIYELYKAIQQEEIINEYRKGVKMSDARKTVRERYLKDYEHPPDEHIRQESTDAYIIKLKDKGGSDWNIRFRQKSVRGFDEASITKKFPAEPKRFEIRHYIANASGANAEVDLRFFNTVPPIPDSVQKEKKEDDGTVKKLKVKKVQVKRVEIHPNEGTAPRDVCLTRSRQPDDSPCGQMPEDEKKYRARFLVFPHILGSHKLDRDTITVKVHKEMEIEYVGAPPKKDGVDPPKTDPPHTKVSTIEVIDIALPVRPQVLRVSNSGTGKPSGFADQEVTAIIEGVNLNAIKKIFFGIQQAEIVGITDNDSAIVKVPKLANLPKGEAVTVPITVEMKSDFYEGKTLTAGYYKYLGEPVPIDVGEPVPVVVRPPRYKGKYPKNGKD